VADLSGEVNYRNFGQAKQVSSKYLSDAQDNFYGGWYFEVAAARPTVDYADKPTGDAVASLSQAMINGAYETFEFNEPQNILDLYLDFWYKYDNVNPRLFIFVSNNPRATFYNYYVNTININGAGAAPTVWTKRTIKLDQRAGGIVNYKPILVRAKNIALYSDNAVGTLKWSGFTIRRL